MINSCFNDTNMVGGTNQFGYNLGKNVHVLLSQIQSYVFEFNLSHQSQKTQYDEVVRYLTQFSLRNVPIIMENNRFHQTVYL